MKRKLDYDPQAMASAFDAAFRTAFEAAVYLTNLKDRSYYVCLDGSSRPFYGFSHDYSKHRPKRRLEDMTIAGQWATGAFRQKGARRGAPMYPGTLNKHDEFILSAHLYHGQESFSLGVRRGLVTPDSIEEFVGILDALPVKPAFLFADKEFPFLTKMEKLRPWCDANGVGMLIAHPKNAAVRRILAHAWHTGEAKRINGAREAVYWAVRRHDWAGSRTTAYNLLTFYFHEDPRKDSGWDHDQQDLIQLPNGIYALSFYTNVEVTAENAYWLWTQYAARWSCENTWKRLKAYCGQSHGHGLFLRDFFFNAAMLLLSSYGLWRLERAQRLKLPPPSEYAKLDPVVSHSRFFEALQTHLRVSLATGHLAKSKLPAAPAQ